LLATSRPIYLKLLYSSLIKLLLLI